MDFLGLSTIVFRVGFDSSFSSSEGSSRAKILAELQGNLDRMVDQCRKKAKGCKLCVDAFDQTFKMIDVGINGAKPKNNKYYNTAPPRETDVSVLMDALSTITDNGDAAGIPVLVTKHLTYAKNGVSAVGHASAGGMIVITEGKSAVKGADTIAHELGHYMGWQRENVSQFAQDPNHSLEYGNLMYEYASPRSKEPDCQWCSLLLQLDTK